MFYNDHLLVAEEDISSRNFCVLVDVAVLIAEHEQNLLGHQEKGKSIEDLSEKEDSDKRIFSHFPRKLRSSLVNKFVTGRRNTQQIHENLIEASTSSSTLPIKNPPKSKEEAFRLNKFITKRNVEEGLRLYEEEQNYLRLRRQEKGKAICDSKETNHENLNGASSSSKCIDLNMFPADDADTEEEPQIPLPLRVSQEKKRTIKAKKAKIPPLSWRGRDTPERLLQFVRDINGSDPRLIFEKTLTETDINPNQSRLLIPFNGLIRDDFLTHEELGILQQDTDNNSLRSILFDQRNVKWGVIFKRRDMKKKKKGTVSLNYALISGWIDMAKANGLEEGVTISLWSFRWRGMLCFVVLPPPTD